MKNRRRSVAHTGRRNAHWPCNADYGHVLRSDPPGPGRFRAGPCREPFELTPKGSECLSSSFFPLFYQEWPNALRPHASKQLHCMPALLAAHGATKAQRKQLKQQKPRRQRSTLLGRVPGCLPKIRFATHVASTSALSANRPRDLARGLESERTRSGRCSAAFVPNLATGMLAMA